MSKLTFIIFIGIVIYCRARADFSRDEIKFVQDLLDK